jgi:glycosyltransferase involved in cell wall biosynthesis
MDIRANSTSRPFLSVIIPAFNEEKRLPGTLGEIAAFVEARGFDAEVIVVDNVSNDRTERKHWKKKHYE